METTTAPPTTTIRATTTTVPTPRHWSTDLDASCGAPKLHAVFATFAVTECQQVDLVTGEASPWFDPSVRTLASGRIIGMETVAASATSDEGTRWWEYDPISGARTKEIGVGPADDLYYSWFPTIYGDVVVGILNPDIKGHSGMGSGTSLLNTSRVTVDGDHTLKVHDLASGTTKELMLGDSYQGRWALIDGVLINVTADGDTVCGYDPLSERCTWTLPVPGSISGGAPRIGEETTMAQLGVVHWRKIGNVDVRTGQVVGGPTMDAPSAKAGRAMPIFEAPQVTTFDDAMAQDGLQVFTNNGFVAAFRNNTELWSYRSPSRVCDYASIPSAQGRRGILALCNDLAVFEPGA